MRHCSRQGECAKRCVNWMPDVAIRSIGDQASFSWICHCMIASSTERHSRPNEQHECQHLKDDDEWRGREKFSRANQSHQTTKHPDITSDRNNLQHNVRRAQLTTMRAVMSSAISRATNYNPHNRPTARTRLPVYWRPIPRQSIFWSLAKPATEESQQHAGQSPGYAGGERQRVVKD